MAMQPLSDPTSASARPQPNGPRLLHALALLTAAATFPLIFMGGLVTSHHAGMSVPDWPNSWGYNMFTFPPSKWVGGILFEHTHRLAGAAVGLLVICVVATAWLVNVSRTIRWTAVALLLAVIAQGTLGGLRVVLSDKDLAIVHGICAQLFFCFVATFCVMTAPPPPAEPRDRRPLRAAMILSAIATAVVLMQLVIGAIIRHSDAGLAIPDFPLSYGHWLPPTQLDPAFRAEAIHRFGTELGLNQVTLFQIWIHFAHRIGAALVTLAIVGLGSFVFARQKHLRRLVGLSGILLGLLAVQITLGILTVLLRKPADVASAHVAVGSLVLVTSWVICVRAFSRLRAGRGEEAAGDFIAASYAVG